jgi:polyhydroxyalkanoate synthesis regulator phasin
MSSLDAIEGVSSTSSINPYDPSNYSIASSQEKAHSSIDDMASSVGMDEEQAKKFFTGIVNFINDQNKSETENAVNALKEATKATEQV